MVYSHYSLYLSKFSDEPEAVSDPGSREGSEFNLNDHSGVPSDDDDGDISTESFRLDRPSEKSPRQGSKSSASGGGGASRSQKPTAVKGERKLLDPNRGNPGGGEESKG